VLNAEKREALIIKRAEDAKEKAEFAEAAAREAAAMDHFKRSGQVPRLVGLSGSSSSSQPAAAAGGGGVSKEWATTIPEGELHLGTLPTSGWAHGGAGAGGAGGLSGADGEPMGARAAAKAARRASRAAAKALKAKKRNPKQVPTLNSESALEHPTASAGGLDELLTESPAFPFPRAVHLRERRARDPDLQGDSDDDSDDSEGSAHRDDDDEDGAFDSDSEDSIESDDYDEDPKEASVTSTADEAVRLAMVFAATGGVAFGGAAARPVSPGGLGAPTPRTPRTGRSDSSHGATHRAGAAAARAEAEDLASKVTQYMGGPPVDGVGAELKMLFSTLPVTPAAFARGKVSTPAFMHSMISPCIDPGDITGNKVIDCRSFSALALDSCFEMFSAPFGFSVFVNMPSNYTLVIFILYFCFFFCHAIGAHSVTLAGRPPPFHGPRRRRRGATGHRTRRRRPRRRAPHREPPHHCQPQRQEHRAPSSGRHQHCSKQQRRRDAHGRLEHGAQPGFERRRCFDRPVH